MAAGIPNFVAQFQALAPWLVGALLCITLYATPY